MIKQKLQEMPAAEESDEESLQDDSNVEEENENSENDSVAEEEEDDNANEDEDDSENNEDDNLDASATESDDESDNETNGNIETNIKTRQEKIAEDVVKKYQERQGKQLFVRFKERLPETIEEFEKKTKTLSSRIIRSHKPRQKYARFCLIDFATQTERDEEFKKIKKLIKSTEEFKGIVVSLPRTENSDLIQELAQRKVKSLENKKAKKRLKRLNYKLAGHTKNFTSSVVISNLPTTTSVAEIRTLVPSAVDIQMKKGRGKMNASSIATITLPSTLEARAVTKQNLSLNGVKLYIRFDVQNIKKKPNKKQRNNKHKQQKGKLVEPQQNENFIPIKEKSDLKEGKSPKAILKNKQQKENLKRKLPKKVVAKVAEKKSLKVNKNQKKRKVET